MFSSTGAVNTLVLGCSFLFFFSKRVLVQPIAKVEPAGVADASAEEALHGSTYASSGASGPSHDHQPAP